LIATPARLIGVSSSTAFIALGILAPVLAFLAIFWLIQNVTQDPRLAAAGSIGVLCFGALAAGEGMVQLLSSGSQYSFLPFLRRYQPALAFPLFFLFCAFVWRALTYRHGRFVWSALAGLSLGLLTFSYFYLWTTAFAWLTCLILLWFVANREKLRRDIGSILTVLFLGVVALVPYFILLSRRFVSMDSGQKLTLSHAADLFRIPELLCLSTILLLAFSAIRGRLNWRASETLFAVSFCLAPLIVFNQQVITGRSLQPFHYEWFIANYVALVGVVLASVVIWRGHQSAKRPTCYRFAAHLMLIAILWATIEVLAPTKVIIKENQFKDRAALICQRLRELSESDGVTTNTESEDPRPLVLASDHKVAVILPTFAPQAVLWAPHFDFLNLAPGESRARFYQYLYYTGIDGSDLSQELGQPLSVFASPAFGHERVVPDLSVEAKPITKEEIAAQVADYEAYRSSFTRERAWQRILSFVIVPVDGQLDLSNLDRWYQRDQGEQVGDYILYRVNLRP
ncbi:MAG: hypothetical protein ACRD8U_07855, partial [Pyrinomonadaceae bacterium]